jgi:hypothetical protein
MKKVFSDVQLEETRSFAWPVQDITSFNLSVDSGAARYAIC